MKSKILKKNTIKRIILGVLVLSCLLMGQKAVLADTGIQEVNGFKLGLESSQVDFSMSETPDLTFKFSKKRKVFSGFKAWFMSLFVDEYKDIKISARLINKDGHVNENNIPLVAYLEDGEFRVALPEN